MLEYDPSAEIQALRSTFGDIKAVVDVERLTADIARRHTTSLNKDKAVHRLVAALPLLREQDEIWAVETAFRINTDQDPRLADISGATWHLRRAECREVLETLAVGRDVPTSTVEFEVERTMALMDGLSTQLRSGRRPVARDEARAIFMRHLQEIQNVWPREVASQREGLGGHTRRRPPA